MNKQIYQPESLYAAIKKVRKTSPVVHNITNLVVINTTANMLLALNASPIMAHAVEELNEISNISQALVLNIGTLDSTWINAMQNAQRHALTNMIPIILDPVGAGATHLRTKTAVMLLKSGVNFIRANASEILALDNHAQNTKGVDSQDSTESAVKAARTLSEKYHCCVIVSGERDFICYQQEQIYLDNGTPMLTKVTGMGCSASAMIAAFAACIENPVEASLYAMATLNLAAEKAQKLAQGPGSFYLHLLDCIYHLDIDDLTTLVVKCKN